MVEVPDPQIGAASARNAAFQSTFTRGGTSRISPILLNAGISGELTEDTLCHNGTCCE